jgi:hypothetical protein
VFKAERYSRNRVCGWSSFGNNPRVILLNTPSPFMERGPGGEVFAQSQALMGHFSRNIGLFTTYRIIACIR